MKPLILDCSQLCHQAGYAMAELSFEEKKTGVLYGFLRQVFKLAHDFGTNQLVFCWDSRKSFRRQVYPEYKGDRAKKELTFEEELDQKWYRHQVGQLRDFILFDLGFKNSFVRTGLEADDLIAYAVNQLPGATVVAADSDLYQLLDRCEMYSPRTKDRFGISEFRAKYGIEPKQWVQALAIAGTHNNVKGVPGAGIVKAIQYIKGELPDGVVKGRIEESAALINFNKTLIQLPFQPWTLDFDFKEKFDFDKWHDLFDRFNFRSFLELKFLRVLKEDFELLY